MDKLLYWCAGVDLILIAKASPQDRGRYAMLGVFILFTAALSGASMFFMAGYITDNFAACLTMAAAWALFIFSIDRYLAISITSFKAHLHAGDTASQPTDAPQTAAPTGPAPNASSGYIMAVSIRLLAAIFLSIVISIPVKLAFFEPDINGQLAIENRKATTDFFVNDPQLSALKAERKSIQDQITKLQNEIKTAQTQLSKRYQQMKDESEGKGGSGKRGFGPYYEQTKSAYLQAKARWERVEQTNRPLIQNLTTTDAQLQEKIDRQTQIMAQQAQSDDGLLNRYRALSTLAANNAQINMTLWIITLLFIFIESFPVLTKASQKRDSYEKMLVTLAMEEQPRQLSHYLAQQEARLEAEIDHTPFVVPNQYRAYLIALGVACCAAFPFIYNWVNQLDYPLTPTVIFYMFSPLAIILAFISAEMIALRSRTLWQSLKPAEDLNFNLQALSVLLIPLAIFLYVLLNPNPELLDKSVQLIDTSPVLEHTSFWAGWGVCYLLLLVLVMKNKSVNDPMDESARQKQISEIEKRQRYARQAYRKGSFSLYGLTVFCALCGFLLYTKLPIDAPRATYWQLQGLLTSIPICAVIFHAMGVRVPITTLLSIANSKLKRVYTVSVIFFSITAAGMCMLLLVNHLARPIYTSQQAQSGSPPALSTSAAQVPLASSKPAG